MWVSLCTPPQVASAAAAALTALAPACGVALIVGKTCAVAAALKGAPALVAVLEWLNSAAKEFGPENMPLKPCGALGSALAANRDAKANLTRTLAADNQ